MLWKVFKHSMTITTASYSNSECYDAVASLDDVLAPHILDRIYSEGFDKVNISDKVLGVILNGVAVLEGANKSDSMCKGNVVVVTM